MRRKAALSLVLALSLCAVVPGIASATWRDNGVKLGPGENPHAQLEGTFAFRSPIGTPNAIGVHCSPVVVDLWLTGGTTEAHVTSLEVTNPAKCEVLVGPLVLLTGGTTSVKKVTLTGSPSVTYSLEPAIEVNLNGLALDYEFNNGYKLELTSAESALTPENPAMLGTVLHEGTGVVAGQPVSLGGHFQFTGSDAGTYGLYLP